MNQTGPWSVKGIDQRARDAAREAATAEGLTLGEYLNRLLMSVDVPRPNEISAPFESRRPRPDAASSALDKLTRRIEATEARSTLAITGMDHTILGLVARLEESEDNTAAMTGHVEGLLEELRETHEALQAKVTRLEQDDSARENLEALKSLEQALGKLASHVFEENEMAQNEAQAIKGRVEAGFTDLNERVESMETRVEETLSEAASRVEKAVEQAELRAEGTARHLAERMSNLETHVNLRMAVVDKEESRLDAVEADVSGALESMEATLLRIQDRLNRAETTTDAALQSLEATFNNLDARIDTLSRTVDPDLADRLRAEFNTRFEDITRSVRETVDKTRQELAEEIARAATGPDSEAFAELRSELNDVRQKLADSEDRNSDAIERVGEIVSDRMDALSEQVERRVTQSEERSADAISQVGEQVASVAKRLQVRQDKALHTLATQIDENRKQSDTRLSDALSNVSERLEQMQAQTSTSLSPLQKAITSLATRLESLEDVTAPANRETVLPAPAGLPGDEDRFPDEDGLDAFAGSEEDSFKPGLPFAGETDFAAEGAPEDIPFEDNEEFSAGLTEGGEEQPAAEAFRASPYTDDYSGSFPEEDESDDGADDLDDFAYFDRLSDEEETGYDADVTDPLSALMDLDDSHTEARDSDVFDEDDFDLDVDTFDVTADLPEIENSTQTPATPEKGSDNYIAMARRAAIAASSSHGSMSRREKNPAARLAKASRGGTKLPLYAAASAVVITGAAVGGYLYLRGKQAPATITTASVPAPSGAGVATPASATQSGEEFVPGLPEAVSVTADPAASAEDLLFETEPAADPVGAVPDPAPETPAESPASPALMAATLVQETPPAPVYASIPPLKTLEAAAAAGDPVAEYELAQQYLSTGNLQDGAELMQSAARSGLVMAQYTLSKLHEKGTGVPKDLALARDWTQQAAEGGNVKAMHDLAVFMAQGDGGPQTYAGAVEWFRQAAGYGVVDSQYNLGILYEQGLGISPDLTEALYWFAVAANNGDPGAPAMVRDLTARVAPEAASQAKARAALWNPAPADNAANGTFGLQSWQPGNPRQVRAVQAALNALGFDAGTPDGIAGAGTAGAIRDYQAANGLKQTGTVTPELIESLNAGAAPA